MKSKPKSANELVNTLFNDDLDPSIQILDRIWKRNILYYIGEQHLDFSKSRRMFQRKHKRNSEPTPTSNIIRDYVRSMRAMIINKKYAIRVWPNSINVDDSEASKVGEDLLRHMDTMNDEEFMTVKDWTAVWMVMFGTTFIRTYPAMQSGEWAIDSKGKIIKTGDVGNECVLPFNVRVDSYGDTLRKKRRVGIKSFKPREWVEDTFKTLIKNNDDPELMNYQKHLMKLVSNVSPWKGAGIDTSMFDTQSEDMVVYKEIEFKPTEQYPEGRYVCAVGDTILLDEKRMPIPVKKGTWYYTLTAFHYHNVPGRFYADSGVNDQISPQDSINSIDSQLEMNRKGAGRPLVSMSIDANISRANIGGQSMIILRYDPLLSGGVAPKIDRGIPLPDQVLKERQNHVQSAQDSAGDPKNVLAGGTPSSQASGVLVDILREAAEQGHTPDIEAFYRNLKEVYKKRLVLAKEIYTENRTIKVMGKGNKLRIRQFKASDLRDNTDVRLELDSGTILTNAGQTVQMTELAKSGVFGDISQQPEVQHELMQRVGLTKLRNKTNVHIDLTERENAMISSATEDDIFIYEAGKEGGQGLQIPYIQGIFRTITEPQILQALGVQDSGEGPVISPDPTFKVNDHALCMSYHLRFILSAEFRELDPINQNIAVAHYDAHNFALQQQQQEQMLMQAQMEQMKNPQAAEKEKPAMAGQ